MLGLSRLSVKGSYEILQALSIGDARFKDLNGIVKNTRTLTKRLREMEQAGLIKRVDGFYRITEMGFEALMRIYDIDFESTVKWINLNEFRKLDDWLRIPLKRLINIFLKTFGRDVISVALYGSTVSKLFKAGVSDVDILYIIEDEAKDPLARENKAFKAFRSSYEYVAFDHWFKMKGFYRYPEITVTPLRKREALNFQPIYLDMVFHRAILYDKNSFLNSLFQRLQEELKNLGSQRVERADGSWYWILKPGLKPGETLRINLTGG